MTTPREPGDREPMISAPPLSKSDLRAATGRSGPAPKEVTLSFWLWTVGAVLSVISAVLLFGGRDDMLAEFRKQPDTGKLSATELDALVTVTLVAGAVIGLAFAGLYLLFAFKARAGRNWARLVLAVLTALSVIGLSIGGFSWFGILSTLVAVVATALLFLPPSNRYFASARRIR